MTEPIRRIEGPGKGIERAREIARLGAVRRRSEDPESDAEEREADQRPAPPRRRPPPPDDGLPHVDVSA